jgi:hypothetical protein
MIHEVETEEIRAAVGKQVEVMAFGVPYVGLLEQYDEAQSRLKIRDGTDIAIVEQERIESFRILSEENDE